jgi:hypothetical protein
MKSDKDLKYASQGEPPLGNVRRLVPRRQALARPIEQFPERNVSRNSAQFDNDDDPGPAAA